MKKTTRSNTAQNPKWAALFTISTALFVVLPSVTAQPSVKQADVRMDDALSAWMSAYEYVPTDAEIQALGPTVEVGERLAKVMVDQDATPVFRARAISMAKAVGCEPIHQALRQILADPTTSPLLKRKIALVVFDVGLPEALTVLDRLAGDGNASVRESAMLGFGRVGTMEAVGAIEKHRATESKPFVKRAADRALVEIRARNMR